MTMHPGARSGSTVVWRGLGVLALVLATLLATVAPAGAQDSPVTWLEYDVSLDVRQDGTVHVT